MVKNNCTTCSNRVGSDYCTMQKDMKAAFYRKCDGWVRVTLEGRLHRAESYDEILKRKARLQMRLKKGLDDENFSEGFLKFVKTGGSWSIKENKEIV